MNHSISTTTGKTKIKIVLLGNQSVGKSSIIQKYVNDRFDQSSNPTVGIDFLAKNTTFKSKSYRLQLWDTAGQQRFRSMIPSYLKDAHCALIVYDVTSAGTLANIDAWLKLYTDNKQGDGFAFLVGNKIDLDYRQIKIEQGIKKAQQLGLPYFQISAKSGENLDMLFNCAIEGSTQKHMDIRKLGMQQEKIKKTSSSNKVIQEQQGEKQQESQVKPQINRTTQKMKQKQLSQEKKTQEKQEKKPITLKSQDLKTFQRKKSTSCC